MRKFYIILTLGIASVAEWSFFDFAIFGVAAPFGVGMLFFWFWRIELSARIWLGAAAGIALDSIGIFPFGTHLLVFFAAAILTEGLQSMFSESKAPLTHVIGTVILLGAWFFITPLFAGIIGDMNTMVYTEGYLLRSLPGVIGWIAVFSLFSTGFAYRFR